MQNSFGARWAIGPAAVVILAGCGGLVIPGQASDDGGTSSAAVDAEPAGSASINAQVELPAGVVVSTFAYTLTGPVGVVRAGTQVFSPDGVPEFSIAGVPAPGRYTLDLHAGAENSAGTCTSSALFDVAANQEAVVILIAQCTGIPATAPSSTAPAGASSATTSDPGGAVEVLLAAPIGASFTNLVCTLKGANGLDDETVLALADGATTDFVFNAVPVGHADTIAIKGTAADGSICGVDDTVDVLAGLTTRATLTLHCQ
jgi:hypothetical protein